MSLTRMASMFATGGPKLEFPDSLKRQLAGLLKGAILSNIRDQKQADGSQLKQNSPGYRDYKARMGLGNRALVASGHRFVRPELWSAEWEGEETKCRLVIEPKLDEDTMAIVLEVQAKGYTGWFAPRAEAIEAAYQLVRDWIREEIERAVRSAGRG